MVVSGGVTSDGSLLADAYAYDVERNRWNLVSLATFEPRACHASVATGTGVAMLGGLGVGDLGDLDDPDERVVAAVRPGCSMSVSATSMSAPNAPTRWRGTWSSSPAPTTRAFHSTNGRCSLMRPSTWAPASTPPGPVPRWASPCSCPSSTRSHRSATYPGNGSTIGALPEQGQLDVRSDLTAAWNGSELFVWGGRTERPCTPADGEQGCPGSNGAIIDVGP